MSSKTKKITIRGQTYNLEDVQDLVEIQGVLVPDNWPTKPAECVRLFISTQKMLALEFSRHLAANWKAICKAAQEEAAEGGKAELPISFAFTLDQSAPSVAALTKLKMSFSVRHETTGKPKTHDTNQGEFLDDDLGVVLDVGSVAAESAPPPEPETPAEPEAGSGEAPPAGEGESGGGEGSEAGSSSTRRRRRSKK